MEFFLIILIFTFTLHLERFWFGVNAPSTKNELCNDKPLVSQESGFSSCVSSTLRSY